MKQKNYRIIIVNVLLFLLLPGFPAVSQPVVGKKINQPFTYGEKLVYKMSYSLFVNIPVAEVELSVEHKPKVLNNEDHYFIVGTGKSYRFYNSFFKVHDIYKSYLKVDDFTPSASIRIVNEGSYHSKEYYVYNHSKGYLKNKNGEKFKIPFFTQDILSAVYLARTFDYENALAGDSFMMNVFIDDSTYYVGLRYMGKENITLGSKTFACIKLKPVLIVDRVFKSDEDMTLWVSDDQNRIPVKVYSGISVGAVKAQLYKYENILYPLNVRQD